MFAFFVCLCFRCVLVERCWLATFFWFGDRNPNENGANDFLWLPHGKSWRMVIHHYLLTDLKLSPFKEKWTTKVLLHLKIAVPKDHEGPSKAWRHFEDQNTPADPTGSFTRNHWRVLPILRDVSVSGRIRSRVFKTTHPRPRYITIRDQLQNVSDHLGKDPNRQKTETQRRQRGSKQGWNTGTCPKNLRHDCHDVVLEKAVTQ